MNVQPEAPIKLSYGHGCAPDPRQTVADWADQHMILPTTDAEPGRYRTSRTPYLREIMECMSPSSPVSEITICKSAQMGLTRAATNLVGFCIHRAPAPILFIEPTVDVARKVSKQRIQPMLDEVPCLQGLVRDRRERDSANTILAKDFTGGTLVMTGANSAIGLRFMAAKILILDEIDAYPHDVDGEGSPCDLAEKRTLTFPRRKILKFSTPLIKQTSVIEPAYLESDRRRYHVPCPFCEHGQPLWWAQLKWPEGHPELAKYQCAECGELIPEHHKTRMLEAGQWVAESPGTGKPAGFHINGLYAPYGWVNSWAKLAKEWTSIIHRRDLQQQQTFTNTVLAETWEEVGEAYEPSLIKGRREVYPAPIPSGVLVLTAGVDVQDDRLEALAMGWGLAEESWMIDYQRWMGTPGTPGVWSQLEDWLLRTFTHESGVLMRIQRVCVDTGGHHTKEAYAFVRPRQSRGVFATKGSSQQSGAPLVVMGSRLNGIRLFLIGTDTAKDTLFSRLKLDTPGPGYIHMAWADRFDDEFFEQLTAEQKMNKYRKGVLVDTYYQKKRSRNEALDLVVLNMSALAIFNPNLEALAEHQAREAAARGAAVNNPNVDPVPKPRWFDPMQRGRGFITGWRR